jgi:phosphatidylglycerol---prolipoprotein diacylglyceryl transferase
MFPVLFSLGPITISTFGVFLALSFLMTGYIFWRRGKEEHYNEEELFDTFLLALIWGILWSRIAFIGLNFSHFGFNPLKWFNIFGWPGTIPVVGLVMGAWFLYRQAEKQRWNAFEILDYLALATSLGTTILWIGLFFAGSHFGNPTSLPWGVTFAGVFDKRHPTQLYAAVLFGLLFILLSWLEPRYRLFEWYRDKKHSAQTGFIFALFCIGYGLIGAGLSFLMPPQLKVMGISLDLPVRVAIFLFGFITLYRRSGRSFLPWRKSRPATS